MNHCNVQYLPHNHKSSAVKFGIQHPGTSTYKRKLSYPAKAREYVFTGNGLSVCLSVTTITKKILDGFVPNFIGRFLGEREDQVRVFVTIGRGMWK